MYIVVYIYIQVGHIHANETIVEIGNRKWRLMCCFFPRKENCKKEFRHGSLQI